MDAMMDRIFICEQEQYYATKKLIPNPASSIIPSGKEPSTVWCNPME